jgi:hypothetical protein
MSIVSRRLLAALRSLCVLIVALHLLAAHLPEESAWGVWPYTTLASPWRWLLALLALLSCLPYPSSAELRHRISSIVPGLPQRKSLLFALIAVAFAPLFWLGRIVHTRWGDAYILVNAIPHPDARLTYNWQAPLDIFLHAKTWALGQKLFGWEDAMPAYWVLSTVAGVGFIFILCWLADALGRDRTEKMLLFGLVASLGTMQLFFGYIESYTYISVGILAYLWLALRAQRGEVDLLWPASVLALSHGFHPSTLVLQPSLWLLTWGLWRQGRVRGTSGLLRTIGPSFLVGLAVLALMQAGGHGIDAFLGEDFPGGGDHRWLVPLLRTSTRWEHYTMFSWGHLLDILNQQSLAAPVVLPTLLLITVLARRRLTWRDRSLHFLLLAAACYLLLTLVWNPDYGGRRDWDLFAPASLPLAVLSATLLSRALPERVALRGAAAPLVATQVMHTAAWVIHNTQPWFWPQ